jgi:hypothetical protein
MLKKFKTKDGYLVGVISDTHGRLPLSVLTVFKDTELRIIGETLKAQLIELKD